MEDQNKKYQTYTPYMIPGSKAEPTKTTGRWIRKEKDTFQGKVWWYECSECAWKAPSFTCNWDFKFCPYCGTRTEVYG